jgi:TatD DNase family protein
MVTLHIQIYKMTITDTHTHLYSEEFDQDRDEMIQRALNKGISRFFIPAIDSSYTQAMYDLEKNYPEHVFHVNLMWSYLNQTCCRSSTPRIGTILYWDKTHLLEQQIAFRQIQLAKQYKLPIVIHCEAFDEVFEILEEEKSPDLFGIFHCFTGTHKQALQSISYNMKLGIGGVVTFKNGKSISFESN